MRNLPWMQILWPSFLAACILEMLVFAVVDPAELRWTHAPYSWSTVGVYSVAFFLFWLLTTASSAITAWLNESSTAESESRS